VEMGCRIEDGTYRFVRPRLVAMIQRGKKLSRLYISTISPPRVQRTCGLAFLPSSNRPLGVMKIISGADIGYVVGSKILK
jgi:hypothetical protein